MPVTATRRRPSLRAQSLPLDHVEGLADGLDVLELLLLDGDVELVLEGHDELDEVEAVGVEVVGEAGLLVTLSASTASTSTARALKRSKVSLIGWGLLLGGGGRGDRVAAGSEAHAEAAVDGEHGAGDVGGGVGGEEGDGGGDLVGGADAADGDLARPWRRRASSARAASMSVAIGPGATTLAVMPRRPYSRASERARPMRPALEAA